MSGIELFWWTMIAAIFGVGIFAIGFNAGYDLARSRYEPREEE